MSFQKRWISGFLLPRTQSVYIQFAELPEALQAVCDKPVVGHCLRHASGTGYGQIHFAAS